MKRIEKIIFIAALCLAEVLFFGLTNPQSAPAVVLVVPFVIAYILLFFVINILLRRNFRSLESKRNRKRSAMAATIASLPVILLALQSIGQLTVREIVTLLVIEVVLLFYVTRFSLAKDHS